MWIRRISTCTVSITVGFALLIMCITWLVLGEKSPFNHYFLYHVAIPNFVAKLLPLPYFGLLILRPPYAIQESVGLGLEFVQWLFVGYGIAILFCPKRQKKNSEFSKYPKLDGKKNTKSQNIPFPIVRLIMITAAVQFPLYTLILVKLPKTRRGAIVLLSLLAVHGVAIFVGLRV